jgi:hypothetical protein
MSQWSPILKDRVRISIRVILIECNVTKRMDEGNVFSFILIKIIKTE